MDSLWWWRRQLSHRGKGGSNSVRTNKENNNRHDENKMNKKENETSSLNKRIMSEKGELNKYTQLSNMFGNENGAVTEDARQNKATRSETESQNEKILQLLPLEFQIILIFGCVLK